MIRTLHPDAVVYLPMGRLGNDSLINWLHQENIPLFMPFPLIQPHEEWLDPDTPVSGGTLTARVVVPEIDGGMLPSASLPKTKTNTDTICTPLKMNG